MDKGLDETFDTWAIVALFGHTTLAGHCTKSRIPGFIRVDIFVGDEVKPLATRNLNPKAIYSLDPCTEEVARAMAVRYSPRPVTAWDAQQLLGPAVENPIKEF